MYTLHCKSEHHSSKLFLGDTWLFLQSIRKQNTRICSKSWCGSRHCSASSQYVFCRLLESEVTPKFEKRKKKKKKSLNRKTLVCDRLSLASPSLLYNIPGLGKTFWHGKNKSQATSFNNILIQSNNFTT